MSSEVKKISVQKEAKKVDKSLAKLLFVFNLFLLLIAASWSVGGMFFKEISLCGIIVIILMMNKESSENGFTMVKK